MGRVSNAYKCDRCEILFEGTPTFYVEESDYECSIKTSTMYASLDKYACSAICALVIARRCADRKAKEAKESEDKQDSAQ